MAKMKEYTVARLKRMGFKGYQCNQVSGLVLEVDHVLAEVAQRMNTNPASLCYIYDDVRSTVRVCFDDSGASWGREETLCQYVERPMRKDELRVSQARLQAMGVNALLAQ